MGLFSRSTEKETSREYLRTSPPGQRKDILAFASLNAIVELPVSSAQADGRPVADSCGLDEARNVVRSMLHQDQSVYAWVARSAMVCLDALLETMEGTWDQNLDTAMNTMGLAPGPVIHPAAQMALPPKVQEDVLGLANYALSIFWVVAQPNTESARDRTLYDHLFSSTAPATRETAYDVIAWAGILIGRLRNSGKLPDVPWFGPQFRRVPPMPEPGWYPNPYNRGNIQDGDATFQRFWNGDDWTDQIRNRDGHRWLEQMHSMHTPPNN
jgi:Protein of unknown function (DUF2510)